MQVVGGFVFSLVEVGRCFIKAAQIHQAPSFLVRHQQLAFRVVQATVGVGEIGVNDQGFLEGVTRF